MCDPTNPSQWCTRRAIENHCSREGITKAEFARRVGVRVKTVYGWFHGVYPLEPERVAAELGVDTDALAAAAATTPCPTPDRRRPRPNTPGVVALREAISATGLPLAEIVRRAGVSRTVVYSTLAGERGPATSTITALANAVNLDPVELARAFGEHVENAHDEERIRLGCSRTEYVERLGVSREALWGDLTHHHAVCRGVLRSGGTPEEAAAAAAEARRRSGFAAPTTFGRILDTHVDRTGSTSAQLAAELGVSRQAVTSWRFGYSRPNGENLHRLAQLTGVPVGELTDALDAAPVPWKDEGDQLRQARLAAGMTQQELAWRIGVSEPQVSSLETGKSRITERVAQLASRALDAQITPGESLHQAHRLRQGSAAA